MATKINYPRIRRGLHVQSGIITAGTIRRNLLRLASSVTRDPIETSSRLQELRVAYLSMTLMHQGAMGIPDIRVIGFLRWVIPSRHHDLAMGPEVLGTLQRKVLADWTLLRFPKDYFVYSFIFDGLSLGRKPGQPVKIFKYETNMGYSLLDRGCSSLITGVSQLNGSQLCSVVLWVAKIMKRKDLLEQTAQIVPLHFMDLVSDCINELDSVSKYSNLGVEDVYNIVNAVSLLRLTPENLLDNLSVHACSSLIPMMDDDCSSFYHISLLTMSFATASDLGRMPFRDVLGQLSMKISAIGISELQHCTGPQLARIAAISSLISCKWGYSERQFVQDDQQAAVQQILSKISDLTLSTHYKFFLFNKKLQWRLFVNLAAGGESSVTQWIHMLLSGGNMTQLEQNLSISLNIMQAIIRYREGVGYRDVQRNIAVPVTVDKSQKRSSSKPAEVEIETTDPESKQPPVSTDSKKGIVNRDSSSLPSVCISGIDLTSISNAKHELTPEVKIPEQENEEDSVEEEEEDIPDAEPASEPTITYDHSQVESTEVDQLSLSTGNDDSEDENKYEDLFDVLDLLHSTIHIIGSDNLTMRDTSSMIQIMLKTGTHDKYTALKCLKRSIDIINKTDKKIIPPYQLVYLTHGLTEMVIGSCPDIEKIPSSDVIELFQCITDNINKSVNLNQYYPTALSSVLWAATRVSFDDEAFLRYACSSLTHPESLHRSCSAMVVKAITALTRVKTPISPLEEIEDQPLTETAKIAELVVPRNTGSHLRNIEDKSKKQIRKWKTSNAKSSENNVIFTATEQLTFQLTHLVLSQNVKHERLATIFDLTLLALGKPSCSWSRDEMIPAAAKLSDACFEIWKSKKKFSDICINGKQLARILWSHSSIQLRNHPVCNLLMDSLVDIEVVTDLMTDPMTVTSTLVAASQLRLKNMISLGNLCSRASMLVSDMTPLSLADTLQAVTELRISGRQLQLIAASNAAEKSSKFTPKQAVGFIWHFSRSQLLPQTMTDPTEYRTVTLCYQLLIKNSMTGFNTLELPYLCRLLHTIGHLDSTSDVSESVTKLLNKIIPNIHDVWWRDLANVLWSLGNLKFMPHPDHLQKLIYIREKSNFLPEDSIRVQVWDDFLKGYSKVK